jgi:hypothetical protein
MLPGMGVVGRAELLEGVAEASPWTTFAIDDPQLVPLGDASAAIVYTARATRGSDAEYRAAITSVYRHDTDDVVLCLHQQTPFPEARLLSGDHA